jgi:PIN domain nuclease of toxin-antitoxin system
MNSGYLLDTCTAIWMTTREPLAEKAVAALADAKAAGQPVFVSAITAWEMAMLLARGRIRETKTAEQWYSDFRLEAQIEEQPVTARIFMSSCSLPQPLHKDPIDRILIATARQNDLTIITRDRAILNYGVAGYVRTLAC